MPAVGGSSQLAGGRGRGVQQDAEGKVQRAKGRAPMAQGMGRGQKTGTENIGRRSKRRWQRTG